MSTNSDSAETNVISTSTTEASRLAEIQGQPSRFRGRSLMIERARILSRRFQGGRV